MVRTLIDEDGGQGRGDGVGDTSSAPGVEVTVREDDVGVSSDVETSILGGDPAVARSDRELLLAASRVLALNERRGREEILDSSSSARQNELSTGLVIPGLVSKSRRRRRVQIVALEVSRSVVVDVGSSSKRSKDIRIGNSHSSSAGSLDGPSGQRLQEARRIGIIRHSHVGNGILDVVKEIRDIVGGRDGRAELESLGQGRIIGRRDRIQTLEGSADTSRAGSIGLGVIVGDDLVEEIIVGIQANELNQRSRSGKTSSNDVRVGHTEPSS